MKNGLKSVLAGLVLVGASGLTTGATVEYEKKQVFDVMKKYVEATSCWHSFDKSSEFRKTTLKDVYLINSDKEIGFSEYFVLWGGDKGCNGGSGTMSFFMSEVSKYSNSRPFVVQTDNAFGDNIDINFRFIDSVKQISPDHFEIISWNYADERYGGKDRGNNFPANKFKYTVKMIMGEGWQVTNQVLLEQNK